MEELSVLESSFGHDLSALKTASWIEVRTAGKEKEIARLTLFIDAGESEAIVLAKELNADYILIDDRQGREAAISDELKTISVLGVFILAKQSGPIAPVQPLMEDLLSKAKFRIYDKLYQQVLRQVGE